MVLHQVFDFIQRIALKYTPGPKSDPHPLGPLGSSSSQHRLWCFGALVLCIVKPTSSLPVLQFPILHYEKIYGQADIGTYSAKKLCCLANHIKHPGAENSKINQSLPAEGFSLGPLGPFRSFRFYFAQHSPTIRLFVERSFRTANKNLLRSDRVELSSAKARPKETKGSFVGVGEGIPTGFHAH